MAKLEGSVEFRGGKSYRLRVTIGYNSSGNPVRISKTIQVPSMRKAYVKLDEWIEELKEHGYEDISDITFGNFYQNVWKKEIISMLEVRGYSDYIGIIELRFLDKFERMKLQEIKPYMIRKIVMEAQNLKDPSKKLSRKTRKKMLNAISSVFNLAKKDYRLISSNPALDVDIPIVKGEKKRIDAPYNLEEIELFLEALNKPTTPLKTKALLYTAFITSARVGEISALEEEDISFATKKIRFHQRIVSYTENGKQKWKRVDGLKSGDEKIMSVPDEYLEIIQQIITSNQQIRNKLGVNPKHKYVFGEPIGEFNIPTSLSRHWVRFAKKEKLRPIRFHDLRHTSASFLIANPEIPIKAVQERLGHKDYRTTMNMYVHALEESDILTSDAFGTILNRRE